MKKYLAAILSVALILALSVSALAAGEIVIGEGRDVVITGAEELKDTPALNTDVVETTHQLTHFDDRKELDEEKQKELEKSYAEMYDLIGENATFSEYWFESDLLPLDVVIVLEDADSYEDFAYMCYEDGEWKELEHTFDEENKTVTLTIYNNMPIAIVSAYGSSRAGFSTTTVVIEGEDKPAPSVEMTPTAKRGDRTAEMPTIVTCDEDVTIIPYKDFKPEVDLLQDFQWEIFEKGYKELKEQVPEGMTTRYVFYLTETRPSEVVLRMDDISVGDTVKCKMYNGSWFEEAIEVPRSGRVNISASGSGFYAIFTEIQEG